jgi:hypothetical protein
MCMASRDLFYHSARQGFVFASSTAICVEKYSFQGFARNLRARKDAHTHVYFVLILCILRD